MNELAERSYGRSSPFHSVKLASQSNSRPKKSSVDYTRFLWLENDRVYLMLGVHISHHGGDSHGGRGLLGALLLSGCGLYGSSLHLLRSINGASLPAATAAAASAAAAATASENRELGHQIASGILTRSSRDSSSSCCSNCCSSYCSI